MKRNTFFTVIATVCVAAAFTACSSSVKITARSDAGCAVEMNADLGTKVTAVIKKLGAGLSSMTGAQVNVPVQIFNADEIKQSLSGGDITDVQVKTPTGSSVVIAGNIVPASQQKTSTDNGMKVSSFVKCSSNALSVELSPDSMQKLYESLPQETQVYVDMLMAPVFTGEEMSVSEYSLLLGSVYGTDITKDLISSSIKLTLAPPSGNVLKSAEKNGSKVVLSSKDSVTFSIPLVQFLTMTSKSTFSITW